MRIVDQRREFTEGRHALSERRAFCDRARADRLVALWAATKLGLGEDGAEAYADLVVKAGVTAPGGRGGFDRIAADLAGANVHPEALRTRYAIAMADLARPAGVPPGQGWSLGL